MRVHVTTEDIRDGRPGSLCLCPVARAIQRVTHRDVDLSVGSHVLNLWRGAHSAVLHLPRLVQARIRTIDSCRPCKPFSFPLELPSWAKP